jgi:tRNA dimethylallyltransferase
MNTSHPPLTDPWYLTGPTASGKSEIALYLAERLGAEIISLDSMAVYRGMDIGTAKPTAAARGRIAHHLIDVVEPEEDYSVAEYVAAAHEIAGQIRRRGRDVLLVGGTPLYLKAMLRGIDGGPPADWSIRKSLSAEADALGTAALHRRLAEVDPVAAARLHPGDMRRIVRALEVHRTTGVPISASQHQFAAPAPASQCRVFVIDRPRPELHRRIESRVDAMFSDGLVDEVRGLTAGRRRLGRTASQAVGYREVAAHLAGEFDLSEAVLRTKVRTRRFARRQLTWFRSLVECRSVEVADDQQPAAVAARIAAS